MMKKWIFILCLVCPAVFASGADNAPGFAAEDFANQSVIVAQDAKNAKQCQAVRITPKWYLTAAHCVRPFCDKECMVTVQLLQGDLQAAAQIYHSSASPAVFVPREYRPGNAKNIRHDIALVRFEPRAQDYFFYDARNKKALDEEAFFKELKSSAHSDAYRQWTALQKARPKLLSVTDAFNRRVTQPLAVPDLRQDGIFFRSNYADDFYYFTELRHYMGGNFGVEKGMSGSGVVLPGGDVIGVVSSSLNGGAKVVAYDENDEPSAAMPYSADYFLFTPLSRKNVNFIRATAASFRDGAPQPRFANITGRQAVQTDQTVKTVYAGAFTAEEIAGAKEKK